jgi:hypothetical protein
MSVLVKPVSHVFYIYILYMLTHCIDGQIGTLARASHCVAGYCAWEVRRNQRGKGVQSRDLSYNNIFRVLVTLI